MLSQIGSPNNLSKIMDSLELRGITEADSLEDFEFVDADGELDIDLSQSPITGGPENLSSRLGPVFSALCAIAEKQGLTVSVPGAAKTVATTAVSAITGSLLGGAPGLAVGLMTAAVLTYRSSPMRSKSPKSGSVKTSIRQILGHMTLEQKKELLKELLGCLKQSSVRSLILEILKNETIRNMALEILSSFLLKKVGVSLVKPK